MLDHDASCLGLGFHGVKGTWLTLSSLLLVRSPGAVERCHPNRWLTRGRMHRSTLERVKSRMPFLTATLVQTFSQFFAWAAVFGFGSGRKAFGIDRLVAS